MQSKITHNKTLKRFINFFLGPLLFLWLSYSIYSQIRDQPDLGRSWQHIREGFNSNRIWIFLLVMVLMLVNWGIETIKWKLAVQRIQKVNFITAFKAVLSGVSFSVSTPNRVGEYLGRIIYMDEGNRLKAVSLTITGSMSQLIVTLVMGITGLVFLRAPLEKAGIASSFWLDMILYGSIGALVVLTLFYFRLARLVKWLDKLPRIRRYSWFIEALEHFNATLLLQLLSLSAVRFVVFIIQYFLLFRLFHVEVSWVQCWWTVSVSFLVMAIIPTIALFTDLGLRGKVSLKLVGLFSGNNLGISLSALCIWFINLIVPALAGSLLILSIRKIFSNKNQQKEKEGVISGNSMHGANV